MDDPDKVQRIQVLRQIFLNSDRPDVEGALGTVRELHLEGDVLVRRLEALRERYRLNPPAEVEASGTPDPQIIRIVCSDGLV